MGRVRSSAMTTVYRVAAGEEASKPTMLAYHPQRRGDGSSMKGWFTAILPSLLAGVGVGVLGAGELVVPTMLGTGLGLWVVRKRAKAKPAAVLHLAGHTLRAVGPTGREIMEVHLDDLVDLTLDTKTIEMVQESSGPVPELMYVNSTVGPALDTSRIQLVTRRTGTVPLTTDFMPHSDSLEWRGKMRQFLRKHGWEPDEPPPPKVRTKKKKAKQPEPSEPQIVDDDLPSTTLQLPRRDAD
jgi:hypothetical protein